MFHDLPVWLGPPAAKKHSPRVQAADAPKIDGNAFASLDTMKDRQKADESAASAAPPGLAQEDEVGSLGATPKKADGF